MSCQVDACICIQVLPMRGDPTTCIGCKHQVSVYQQQADDDIVVVGSSYPGVDYNIY